MSNDTANPVRPIHDYQPYEPIRASNPDVLAPVTVIYSERPKPTSWAIMALWLIATLNPDSVTAHLDYTGDSIEPAE